MAQDNSMLRRKVALRLAARRELPADALVLEPYGGAGRIAERCYDGLRGLSIERDARKAAHLAERRPAWRVYQGDAVKALRAGLGADMPFALVDLDPWGSPFEAMGAVFESPRAWPERVELVVNDGLRHKCRLGSAWHAEVLRSAVQRHGNDLFPIYLDVARELVEEIVATAGFRIAAWAGYYCGHNDDMTHYRASLVREGCA